MYVVAGVTGNTGKIVAETLLSQKKPVRVIVRNEAQGTQWLKQGAQVAVADLTDTVALSKALEGAKGVYLLIPPNMQAPSLYEHQANVTKSLVNAVKQAKPEHVVLLSSVGAQHPKGTGPIAGLYHAEQALSGLPNTAVTFLRAAYFIENLGGSLGMLGQGIFPTFFPKDFAFPMVATHDIAQAAVTALLEGPSKEKVIELSSGTYSMSDVAKVLSSITGKTIQVAENPLEAMVGFLTSIGLSADLANHYREMTDAIVRKHVAFTGTHRTLVLKTSLETVLRPMVKL